ncbi:MAG: hypothetical protein KJ950_14075 [Proteobacteria bacterium]|nr:hypothetical protein [Pseudomonadota bacterium]MBU1686668.1 hypothetical protein [Pseudomonadota bacterium]
MKKTILITLADTGYFDQARQLLASAVYDGAWSGDLAVITPDMTDAQVEWFTTRGIIVKKCPHTYEAQPHPGLPLIRFMKHRIFDEFFRQWENVVFLDADIIVCRSLAELAVRESFGAIAGVCHHPPQIGRVNARINYQPNKRTTPLFYELERRYDLNRPVFNSGVMAFSTRFVGKSFAAELNRLTSRYMQLCLLEQAMLNLAVYNQWQELDPKYNFLPGHYFFSPHDLQKAHVVHFSGNIKPWDQACTGYVADFKMKWRKNLEMSAGLKVA